MREEAGGGGGGGGGRRGLGGAVRMNGGLNEINSGDFSHHLACGRVPSETADVDLKKRIVQVGQVELIWDF